MKVKKTNNLTERDSIIRYISLIFMIFLIISGIVNLFTGNSNWVYDRLLSAGLVLLILIFYRKMHIGNLALFFSGLVLIMHNLGLYGNSYLRLDYDRYIHFFGGFAAALVFIDYLTSIYPHKKKYLQIALLAIAVTAGLGSFVEIMEFVGYSYLGEGAGILFYGTGDIGEWNNAAWDMICNTLGAITASIIIFIRRKITK